MADELNLNIPLRKSRAMTSEAARRVKLAGHEAETEFAALIGGQKYPGSRKKDVIDAQGNIHSVKAGDNKWQIFLYSPTRFRESIGFWGAPFFSACLAVFPDKYSDYLLNKAKVKLELQQCMIALKDFLSSTNPFFMHSNKLVFLQEALFHSSEVDYLTIKIGDTFHIFDSLEVIKVIDAATLLENSKAIKAGDTDCLKVLFKVKDIGLTKDKNITIGEIEIRTDEKNYRLVKFWMGREITLRFLQDKIGKPKQKAERVVAYGKAGIRFKSIPKIAQVML